MGTATAAGRSRRASAPPARSLVTSPMSPRPGRAQNTPTPSARNTAAADGDFGEASSEGPYRCAINQTRATVAGQRAMTWANRKDQWLSRLRSSNARPISSTSSAVARGS